MTPTSQAGERAGLERAAQWHEERAATNIALLQKPGVSIGAICALQRSVDDHRNMAAAILALTPEPAHAGEATADATANKIIPPCISMHMRRTVAFRYRNWRGEISDRRVEVTGVYWGATDWHPQHGWLLDAFDLDKREHRLFAMADMSEVRAIEPLSPYAARMESE